MIMALIRREDEICVERVPAIRLIKYPVRSPQDDPEIGAATADAPKEVRVLGFGRGQQ